MAAMGGSVRGVVALALICACDDVSVAGDHALFGEGENGLVVTDAM